jgi:hypothetical protein
MSELGPIGRTAALALALACSACAGKPFDVKVLPRVEPDAISAPSTSGSLSVRAAAAWDEDWLFDAFDANTVLAGVLPVRVEIANAGAAPIETKRLEISAADAAGRAYRTIDAKAARKAIESYYGLTIRNRAGDDLYKRDFAANAIDLRTPLAAGERRQGFLFLRLPDGVRERVGVRLAVASKRDGARAEVALD